MVRALVPTPGAAKVGAVKAPVAPVGRPVTLKVTAELKLPVKFLIVRATEPAELPAWTARADAPAAKVKLGAALTVTTTGADFTIPPPVAITLMLYVPGGVVWVGARVKVLVPSPGAANETDVNVPVIPAGKVLTASDRALAKAPACTVWICNAPLDPCVTATALPAVIVKLGGVTMVNGKLSVWLNVPLLAVMAKL
jgi:hypothetical protein